MLGPGSFVTVTTPGTAVPLSATSQPCAFITIYPRILSGTPNTGQVRLGGKPTSGTAIPSGSGVPLSPGDAAVVWAIPSTNGFNLNEIYVDADSGGDGIQFIWGAP